MTGDRDDVRKPAATLWIPGSRVVIREPGPSELPAQPLILRLLAELRTPKPRRIDHRSTE